MAPQEKSCCPIPKDKPNRGLLSGVLLGLLPHSFCLLFILFSVIGAVALSGFLKKFLVLPYFLLFLVVVSLLLATVSAVIYLKKGGQLNLIGLKNKWRYLTTLYSATILVNLLMFFVVLPALANVNSQKPATENSLAELSIKVEIPCAGHAPLIIDEIKKDSSIQAVTFALPNTFTIKYDPNKTTPEKIASSEIFKTYEATIN